MNSLKTLSDNELIGRLRQLVLKERNTTLSILLHLAEVARRGIHLSKGCSTLQEYCVSELGYGESSAWRRVRVARVIKDIPEVYDYMKKGTLTFSALLQVANILKPGNQAELLPRLVGQSKHHIERVVAEYELPRKIYDQARPTLVKKRVEIAAAPACGTSKAAGERALPNWVKFPFTVKGKMTQFSRKYWRRCTRSDSRGTRI